MNFTKLKENADLLFSKIDDLRVRKMVTQCFFNTIETTCKFHDDGTVFVITGDIPAMWLRDSSAQVMQYLNFINDETVASLIKGVLKQQFKFINIDPYANAFMENENCISEWAGQVETNFLHPQVWERKFELDSLCYPLLLLCKYIEKSNDYSILDSDFDSAFSNIVELLKREQEHDRLSEYHFRFLTRVGQVIPNPNGQLNQFDKGLVWMGFRPSDDICTYHYHIPDNMLAASVLHKLSLIFKSLNDSRYSICETLRDSINTGIEKYGITEIPNYGKVYVSETDCMGNFHINDDANIPSLLSVPYLEYPYMDKSIYENTRRYILSKDNKYYFEGKLLRGIGSPHTPGNKVWPLAIIMQGLTSNNENEINECLNMLINSDANTGYIHESIDADNPNIYSRSWFAWANSLFSQFVIEKILK